MKSYDHKKIEKKWQKKWEDEKAFAAKDDDTAPKLYILDMFPYPSGAGLHVGHVEGYTATDIVSRYKRAQGFNVLHPMGWDAFGLPAENYAVKTGVPPAQTTETAIEAFKRQIKGLGLSYDWSREIGAHRPEYYKWTQWFFLLLYKNGLAYKKKAKVNWDPVDQTVLANEQVLPDGTAERSGAKVVQKDLEQWFFRITDFVDQLVEDLDEVDWPESTKTNQRNWIGRSEGAEIDFYLDFGDQAVNDHVGQDGKKAHITVFTTRPDTIFGATYLVLAPEHVWVARALEHKNVLENSDEVASYVEITKNKTDLDRQSESKEKTGVELRGVHAINPATGEKIPLYIADYVLGSYGTGAIMAVPAHDERDFQFAKKFNLPVKEVVAASDTAAGHEDVFTGAGTVIHSGEFDGLSTKEAKKKLTERFGRTKTTYKLRDWLISRQRYWGAPIPIVYDPKGAPHPIPEEYLPWLLPTDVEFKPTGVSPLGQSKELRERTERLFGPGWTPEVDTMDTFVCSSWYYYRFSDPHNGKAFASPDALKKWLPVDLYMGGAEHTVLHLMYARFFTKVLQKLGFVHFSEPFLKLRHQGTILAEDGTKMSKSKGNVVNPDECAALYGADAVRMYEMFMGPLESMKPWSTNNIIGIRRFLERVNDLAADTGAALPDAVETLMNQTVKKVTDDLENLKMNTAVSALMILLNELEKLDAVPTSAYKTFLQLLAPFAPHLAHELWEGSGEKVMISAVSWPKADAAKLKGKMSKIIIQINGKVRGEIETETDADKVAVEAAARARVASKLEGKSVERVVVVPNRLVNFVVADA